MKVNKSLFLYGGAFEDLSHSSFSTGRLQNGWGRDSLLAGDWKA
ncbi:MAG: hypothetical protein Ct9H300mP28_16280 [Pseudomonadota bacterium]|nr:MAG: hypothetical protein Ct9H300mP28_16280 [Pseudomonadota bacterium]